MPWTEEFGGLQSSDTAEHTHMHVIETQSLTLGSKLRKHFFFKAHPARELRYIFALSLINLDIVGEIE